MRSIAVLAIAILATSARSQQLDLELHAVTQIASFENVYDPGPIIIGPSGLTAFSIDLFVRAQLLGDPEATGLVAFDGVLTDDGTGLWAASPLTNTDVIGFPFGPEPDFTLGRRGMLPQYRATCSCDPGWCNPQDGCPTPEGWIFLPLSTVPGGVPDAVGTLDDVYRVNWTTTDLSPRTVHLTLSAEGAGYSGPDGQLRTLLADQGQIDADTLTLIIDGPGCTCEYDGAPGVNIFDLLAYLELWFLGDDHADIDGHPGLDVFDLLHFLDCWFLTSAGGPCP